MVVALLYFALLLLSGAKMRASLEVRVVGTLYLALFFWVLSRTGMQGGQDISILVSVVLLLFHAFIGGLFFARISRGLKLDFMDLILVLQVVITLQAALIILYFVSWEFRELTLAFIPPEGNIDYRENLFQSRGLTHGSGARLSLIQSFGLMFTAYLVCIAKRRRGQLLYFVVSFPVIFASIFLTGRTGLLMVPVTLCFIAAVVLIRLKLQWSLLKFCVLIPMAMLGLYLALRFGYQHVLGGFTTVSGEDGFDRLVRWVTSEFINDGQLRSRTAMLLQSHWFLPTEWHVLLFGDPSTWSLNRISSDAGFVRMWFGYGIIGMLIAYSLFIAMFLFSVLGVRGIEAKLMIGMLGTFLMAAEVKEPFLMDLNVNVFLVLMFAYVVSAAKPDWRQSPWRMTDGARIEIESTKLA